MRFISLFAGIGGIDLGLERAGMECVAQVEWDDWCTRVLEKHWPDVPRWKDIHDIAEGELPDADLIARGSVDFGAQGEIGAHPATDSRPASDPFSFTIELSGRALT